MRRRSPGEKEPGARAIRVGVLGAGNVGGYLGVALSAAGADVCMVYKPGRVERENARYVSRSGGKRLACGPGLRLSEDARCLAAVDLCLVAVKSYDTVEASRVLAAQRFSGWVLSIQNGLGNDALLREQLGPRVLGGLVTFNVMRDRDGARVRCTKGKLLVEDRPEARPLLHELRTRLCSVGEKVELCDHVERTQATKLLLNLNNGVCAATGLSVLDLLRNADARWCFARCLREGESVLRGAGLAPSRLGVLSPRGVAFVMRLPGPLLELAARLSGSIDPRARLSTLQDLERAHRTEIMALNGTIVELARRAGGVAPANEAVTRAVQEHEQALAAGSAPVFLSGRELRDRLRRNDAGYARRRARFA